MLDQIKHMPDMQTHVLGKTTTIDLDIEFMEARVGAPKTSTGDPPVGGLVRWQLKDPKSPKFNGNAAARLADAVEQWLSKWEQCFCLCCISNDEIKIHQATYNLLKVAH